MNINVSSSKLPKYPKELICHGMIAKGKRSSISRKCPSKEKIYYFNTSISNLSVQHHGNLWKKANISNKKIHPKISQQKNTKKYPISLKKNEALTVYASSFEGMKMQIICYGCYSCCLVHCFELLKCSYKCSMQIYTEYNKNIYHMSYSSQINSSDTSRKSNVSYVLYYFCT